MEDLGNYPIFSQPVLPPNLDDARIQDKLEALNLSISIKNQKKFVNLHYSFSYQIICKHRLIITNPTYQAVITTDASLIAWGATFQAVKQNIRINPRKEMEKLSQEEKDLAILSENGKLYCPTNLANTKWSYMDQIGLKLNQKFQILFQYC
jgi:hypothetical protein